MATPACAHRPEAARSRKNKAMSYSATTQSIASIARSMGILHSPTAAMAAGLGHSPLTSVFANGRLMKHPRAANFAWKCENGKYLYWFHNHGGNWYEDRNPRLALRRCRSRLG